MPMKFEKVIDHITALRPQFRDEIRGCSEAEIAALEKILGRAVPPVYRTFLTSMGHGIGGINTIHAGGFLVSAVDLSFERVLRVEKKAKHRLPPRFTLLGSILEDPFEDLCLDTEPSPTEPHVLRVSLARDPKWANSDFESACYDVAQSLAEMIFGAAFVSFLFPRYRVEAAMRHTALQNDGLREADKILRRMNFERHPASGGWSAFYTRADAVALVYQSTRLPLRIRVRAQTAPIAQKLAATLEEHLGFARSDIREKA